MMIGKMSYKRNICWGLLLFWLVIGTLLSAGLVSAQTGTFTITYGKWPSGWGRNECKGSCGFHWTLIQQPSIYQLVRLSGGYGTYIDIFSDTKPFGTANDFRDNLSDKSNFRQSVTISQVTFNGYQAYKFISDTVGLPHFEGYRIELGSVRAIIIVEAGTDAKNRQEVADVLSGLRFNASVPFVVVAETPATKAPVAPNPRPVGAPSSNPPPTNSPEIPITPGTLAGGVLGTLASAGILGAAVTNILKTNKENRDKAGKDPNEKQDPNEVVGLILQLSQDVIALSPQQPASLSATIWQVTPNGATSLAPEATIQFDVPGTAAGFLQVTPTSGPGQMTCTFSQVGQSRQQEVIVTVNASAAQGATSAQIKVRMGVVLAAVPEQPGIRYYPAEKRWVVPNLIVYYHVLGSDTPVPVGFKYELADPAFSATKDILKLVSTSLSEDGMTTQIHAELKREIDLEELFGKDLADNEGKFEIQVNVVREDQTTEQAKIALQIRPQLMLIVKEHAADQSKGGHKYEEMQLEPMEFITDTEDTLSLDAYFARTDKEINPDDSETEAEIGGEIKRVDWLAPRDREQFSIEEQAFVQERVHYYQVKSALVLDWSPKERQLEPTLVFELGLKPNVPRNYELQLPQCKVRIKPQYPRLKFWVVPGLYRGTSDAVAYLSIMPSGRAWIGQDLELEIKNPPGPATLSVWHGLQQKTRTEPDSSGPLRLEPGTAYWTLEYSKMSWDNLKQAEFKITCFLLNANGRCSQASQWINVDKNVQDLLIDMYNDPHLSARLNNPYWKDSSTPEFLRGPIWNISKYLEEGDKWKDAPFVCYLTRHDIITWLEERRVRWPREKTSLETMGKMNGIEFDYCAIQPVHVWIGIFLSGTDRADYRALDPWWGQHWSAPEDVPHTEWVNRLMLPVDENLQFGKLIGSAGAIIAGVYAVIAVAGSTLTLAEVAAAVYAWLKGTSTATAATKILVFPDSDYVDKDGKLRIDQMWFAKLIRDEFAEGKSAD